MGTFLTDEGQTPIAMRHLAVDGTTLYGINKTSGLSIEERHKHLDSNRPRNP